MAGKAQGRDQGEGKRMSKRSREELERTAYHEAGHSVMSFYLHVTPGTVSIRPGKGYHGVSKHGRTGRPPVQESDLDCPIVEMKAKLRRGLEREICIALAGKTAEQLMPLEPSTGYIGDPDHERAARLAELAVPVGREAAALALTESDGAGEWDMTRAESKAHGAVGRNLQASYLRFLECVIDEIMSGERFQRLVRALVAELLKYKVLSAAAVKMILIRADTEADEEQA
jgi:hypothetical protein